MSKNIAIKVNNLSKVYKLYDGQRDVIKETFHPFRKKYHKKFYALKDISFEVRKGEVLGIIGKNGSGKSTLLKILASVVSATSGTFRCNGRISTLLELGGGFNKELTAIENIYFMGAIRGYSKVDIERLVPEILEFAEIGDYAYQPAKTYSSGMYVRLTFSVAIHIDPEILLTDEALAVGDMRFQQKCFRKIREFKDIGKTIVLVSHSTQKITEYCTHAIWLHKGKIKMEGDPQSVTSAYQAFMNSNDNAREKIFKQKSFKHINSGNELDRFIHANEDVSWYDIGLLNVFGTEEARVRKFGVNQPLESLKGGEKIRVSLIIEADKPINIPGIHLILNGRLGAPIFKINSYVNKQSFKLNTEKPNLVAIDFTFPEIGNGQYTLSIVLVNRKDGSLEYLHWLHDALVLKVTNPDYHHKQGTIIALKDFSVQLIPNHISQNS